MMKDKDIWYDWFGYNEQLFYLIYGRGLKTLEPFLPLLDWLGEYQNFPQIFGIITLGLFLRYLRLHAKSAAFNWSVIKRYCALLIALVAGFLVMALLVHWLKDVFALPRPYVVDPTITVGYGKTDIMDRLRTFPSGHVAFTAFWITVVFHKVGSVFRYAFIAALILMCWFRIAAGLHYPVDTLAGLAVGSGIAWLSLTLTYRLMRVR